MNKKILILYTSIGLGHKYIAFNIAHHLERAGFEVRLEDILQVQEGWTVKVGEWFHRLINVKYPFIWRWLYFSNAFSKATMWMRVPLAGKNRDRVKTIIEDYKPDMVIATQTSASAPIAYMKRHGEYNGLFVIAFSDYHFHPYWFYGEADLYLANIPEQQTALEKLGVKPDRIAVCGITLKPQESVDAVAVKQKLGLTQCEKIILMSSGSLGIGFSETMLLDFVAELSGMNAGVHVVVVCGKNESMKQQLEELAQSRGLAMTILGFHEPMAELYAITDVFLTKPGGLTVAEALRDNVPMLVTHFLPGQEELNYEYLVSRNLMHPMPAKVTAGNLALATIKIMEQNKTEESRNSTAITQKNNEGAALIKSIKNLFHIV